MYRAPSRTVELPTRTRHRTLPTVRPAPADGGRGIKPDPGRQLRRVHFLRQRNQFQAPGSCTLDAALYRVPGKAGAGPVGRSFPLVIYSPKTQQFGSLTAP